MRLATLSIVAASFFLCLTPAVAQDDSPAALRKQIDQLTEQIAELEAALARTTDRIELLTDENRRLRDALKNNKDSAGDPDDSTETEETPTSAEAPADPFASPDSLRIALEKSWNAEFEGVDVSNDNESRQYLRDVRRWAGKAKRDYRGPFTWRANVVSARADGRSTIAMIQVLDDRDMPIGEPAEIEATGSAARTVLQAASDAVLELTGNQSVDIDIDARLGASADQLGPYLEHTINYTVTSARYE